MNKYIILLCTNNLIITLVVLSIVCFLACYNVYIYNRITYCIIKSNNYLNMLTKSTRGKNYWLTNNDNNCFITTWHIYHLVQYIFLGYFFPSYYVELICIGILFEFFEKYFFECDDIIDIVFNIIGLNIGLFLHFIFRRRMFPGGF